jgi:two-component system phosphate regulon response regulator PhoB
MAKQKILVVDDEPDILEMVGVNLKAAGFEVVTAASGAEALRKVQAISPSLIVLDVLLPESDGLDVCKGVRRDPKTAGIPIIMLTAKASEVDRVVGLELGADDYMTKPFSPRELVLRIKKLLTRHAAPAMPADTLRCGELVIDRPRHRVTYRDKPLDLTVTEFNLVAILAERKGRVQSREQLLKDVWGYNSLIDTRTVDTHMRRLRDKLGPAATYLDTVRGVGYRFKDE